MHHRLPLLAILLLALPVAGCGKARRFGDDGGVPVTMTVTLERGFVSEMRNRQGRVGVGVGAGMSSGGRSSIGTGIGLSFSATTVYLLGGDGPNSGSVFRKEIGWGETTFQVPLRPGRTLHLTVQVQGGREGWEAVGTFVAPDQPGATVRLDLGVEGPRLVPPPVSQATTTPLAPPAAPAPAAPAPAAPAPAP